MIDQSKILGEKSTGFEKRGAKGPFSCGNCHYMKDGCTQEDMKKHSEQPRLENGNVEVGDGDCCEYVDRKGSRGPSLPRYRIG
jgi:hypothetical protein